MAGAERRSRAHPCRSQPGQKAVKILLVQFKFFSFVGGTVSVLNLINAAYFFNKNYRELITKMVAAKIQLDEL